MKDIKYKTDLVIATIAMILYIIFYIYGSGVDNNMLILVMLTLAIREIKLHIDSKEK